MVRNHILCGFLSAMLLPACINAAEIRPNPRILVVTVGVPIEGFEQFVAEIAGPNFDIIVKDYDQVFPRDLHDVKYVLVGGALAQDELKKIPKVLSEEIKKEANKALVIFRFTEPLKIDRATNKLFKGVFQLNHDGLKLVENERSDDFKRWFQDNVLSKQTVVALLQRGGAIGPQLQQRIDQFARDLGWVNQEELRLKQEVLRLNQELSELVRLSKPQ